MRIAASNLCEVLLKALSVVKTLRSGRIWYGSGRHYQGRAGWLKRVIYLHLDDRVPPPDTNMI